MPTTEDTTKPLPDLLQRKPRFTQVDCNILYKRVLTMQISDSCKLTLWHTIKEIWRDILYDWCTPKLAPSLYWSRFFSLGRGVTFLYCIMSFFFFKCLPWLPKYCIYSDVRLGFLFPQHNAIEKREKPVKGSGQFLFQGLATAGQSTAFFLVRSGEDVCLIS